MLYRTKNTDSRQNYRPNSRENDEKHPKREWRRMQPSRKTATENGKPNKKSEASEKLLTTRKNPPAIPRPKNDEQ